MPAANDRPLVSAWVLDLLAVIVALGWLGTLVYDAVNVPYQQPWGAHILMVGVSGSLFGFRIATRRT